MTEVTIEFDGLQPVFDDLCVEGMVLSGKAVLESSHEFEAHEFYVASVELDAAPGKRYDLPNPRSVHNPDPFKAKLFKAIASQIENASTTLGKYAQACFSEAVRDEVADKRAHVNAVFRQRQGLAAVISSVMAGAA